MSAPRTVRGAFRRAYGVVEVAELGAPVMSVVERLCEIADVAGATCLTGIERRNARRLNDVEDALHGCRVHPAAGGRFSHVLRVVLSRADEPAGSLSVSFNVDEAIAAAGLGLSVRLLLAGACAEHLGRAADDCRALLLQVSELFSTDHGALGASFARRANGLEVGAYSFLGVAAPPSAPPSPHRATVLERGVVLDARAGMITLWDEGAQLHVAALANWLDGEGGPRRVAAPAQAVEVPTYLREPQALPPTPLELPLRAEAPPSRDLAATDTPTNDHASNAVHETVLLPSPAELAAMFGPKPNPLPFSGEADPARLAELLRPPGLDQLEDEAGLTEELPVPAELARMVAASQPFAKKTAAGLAPRLELEQYAALRAALVVHGETDEPTLRRFGVRSSAEKDAFQTLYFARFKEEPGLRDRFQALLMAEIARARAAR